MRDCDHIEALSDITDCAEDEWHSMNSSAFAELSMGNTLLPTALLSLSVFYCFAIHAGFTIFIFVTIRLFKRGIPCRQKKD